MSDVVSYLNNVLGPYHDLTIAARTQLELSDKPSRNFTDGEQIVLFVLSGLIYSLEDNCYFKWNDESIQNAIKDHIFITFAGLEGVIEEVLVDNSYPEDSDELMMLGLEVEALLCSDNLERFQQLRKVVEQDCAGDVLEMLFG
jgi:hypothetical protein